MMNSIRSFFCNFIKYFIYIAVFAQIVSGTVYLVCNFSEYIVYPESQEMIHVARGLVFDEYTGVLYPLFIRICLGVQEILGVGYYLIVHGVQLCLFAVAAYYLAKSFFQGKKAYLVAAYITSFPMCLQCVLMVSPFAFRATTGFFIVGAMVRIWKKIQNSRAWILLFVSFVAAAFLVPDDLYMWFFVLVLFAIAFFFKSKASLHVGKRILLILMVVLIFFVSAAALEKLTPAGARGRMQKTVSSALFQRTLWPEFRYKFGFLPMDILEKIDSDVAMESDALSESMVYIIGSTLDREYGFERANELYREAFFNQLAYNKRAIFKSILQDFTGYLLTPYSSVWYISGQEGSAFSTLYGLMGAKKPGMTYGFFCISFVSLIVLTFKRMLSFVVEKHKKAGWLLGCILIYQALWHTIANVQGVDYRYSILGIGLFVIFIFGDKLLDISEKKSEKKSVKISGKKVLVFVSVVWGFGLIIFSISSLKDTYKKSNLLEGKQIVCFGDSIWGLVQDETGIAALVEDMTGATVTNLAIPGMSASKIETGSLEEEVNSNSFIDILQSIEHNDNILQNADYVIIAFGLNDYFKGVPIEDADSGEVDTYKGALDFGIKYLKGNYPDSEIMLIGQTYCQFYSYGVIESDSHTQDFGGGVGMDYVKAAEELASAYNLLFVNQYEELPIHRWNGKKYLTDATHLNEKGRVEYAKVVSECLLKNEKERNAK